MWICNREPRNYRLMTAFPAEKQCCYISASKPTTPEPKKRTEKEEKRGQTPKAKRKGKNAKKIEVEEELLNPSELSDSLLEDSSVYAKAMESEFQISSVHESSALSNASALHEKAVPKALVVTFLSNQVELFETICISYKRYLIASC
ncbi:uncharacterized protein MONOS_18128 [Monocercomonoides exilis]|uniref:uncharacterized protein n=1 Tax=Monocercomonoides exilis TaxID=2049356 RepID=UPI00355A49FC|nr:hypothetical protein MONOS_18128 [Monocercomonoides exilis]